MKYKDHGMKYLAEKLTDAGVVGIFYGKDGKQNIYYWIRQGWLKLRRKPPGMYYRANDKEIEEIIREFSPGGHGYWAPNIKYPVSKPEVAQEEGRDTEVTGPEETFAVDDSPFGGLTGFGVKPQGSLAY